MGFVLFTVLVAMILGVEWVVARHREGRETRRPHA